MCSKRAKLREKIEIYTPKLVLPKFSSVRFSPHFLRTENRTDRIFSELNRTRIELVRTGSTCSVRFQNRFEQANRTKLYIKDTNRILIHGKAREQPPHLIQLFTTQKRMTPTRKVRRGKAFTSQQRVHRAIFMPTSCCCLL